MLPRRNAEILEEFRLNKFPVLINVQMLTEGTDLPDVHTVFLTRQTTSQILLTQMVGRALRGPRAGGTKEAHLVFFIDNWNHLINFAEYGKLEAGSISEEDVIYGKVPPFEYILY